MTERDIQEKLDQWYPTEHFDVVLKCWILRYVTSNYDNHCGEHTQITRACIKNPGFQKLMNECRSRAELLWARGQTCIRVVSVCGHDRHRSVAVSSALQAVYLKVGFNSLGPYHMSQAESWSDICHTCKDCRPNYHKEELFTSLAHHYREFDATRTAARANLSR